MTKMALEIYHLRMWRVLDYIDQHLDEKLGLDVLSDVAAVSKHHFHRQFTAIFGITVHRYVQLVRMKRAAHQLAFCDDDTITDISMDAGYEAPEAFIRAFRQRLGQGPTTPHDDPAVRRLAQSRRIESEDQRHIHDLPRAGAGKT